MSARPQPSTTEDSPRGLAFAVSAYLLWGFLPLYMKQLSAIPALEVLAHRVIWSVPVAALVLIALGRTRDIATAIRTPRMLGMALVTAALVSVNWGIYVWAIGAGRALDAALGYYINPLFSVFLGAVILGERLGLAQKLAIALAAMAVALLTWEAGSLPWVALALTFSWGFYAYFRKTLPIGPNQGFLLEVLLLTPPALAYMAWLAARSEGHFLAGIGLDTALLLGCGIVTAVPLMLYANGAKLLRLSTIGMMQYIAPTMIFVLAVFVFDEPFSGTKLVAFALIWAALAIFTGSMLARARRARPRAG